MHQPAVTKLTFVHRHLDAEGDYFVISERLSVQAIFDVFRVGLGRRSIFIFGCRSICIFISCTLYLTNAIVLATNIFGKPQFATKPGSTKGKGPSSPLA